ncbi:MAG: hypothetical protein K5784_04165 [Clostridiales bacterium]|nr:hypothetical protein [Clostridiales bacterium]
MKKHSQCIDQELGIDLTYSIIIQMSRSAKFKGAMQDLGAKKELLFAKFRILHEFAKRLRVE